ncbi:hypothetical protein ACIF8W_17455 [Streptomyces sp. NPDC085639]
MKDIRLHEPTGAESLFACAPEPAPVPQEEPAVARLTFSFVERTFNFT